MNLITVGIIWLMFIIPATIALIPFIIILLLNDFDPILLFTFILMFLFVSVFWYIGISIIRIGMATKKRNKATELNGEICYAKILEIYHSGTYVNRKPEYKANFLVYLPSRHELRKIAEIIGFNHDGSYEIGTYVVAKYYEGDINIETIVDKNQLPYDALDEFERYADFDYKDITTIDDNSVTNNEEEYYL